MPQMASMQACGRAGSLPSVRAPTCGTGRTLRISTAPRRGSTRCRQAPEQHSGAPIVQDQQLQEIPAPPAVPPPPPYALPLPPPGIEGATTAVYPGYPYPVQQQQQLRGQHEYYMAPPPGYYALPPPAYREQEASSGAPWWIWVTEFVRNAKSPQQMMMEMAMKQMMGNQGSGSPFGNPGAMPPFPGAAGMPPFPPGGFGAPPGATPTTVDVPSSRASDDGAAPAPRKGEKFASRKAGSPEASTAQGAASSKPPSSVDVVDPIVKEPPSSSSSSSGNGGGRARKSSSFFADAAAASSSSASGAGSSHGPAGGNGSKTSGAGSGSGTGSVAFEMMEQMLRNPQMQAMLYPYLPEAMRNPQSIEFMLSNPEVKKQMAEMLDRQGMMSPQMLEMLKNVDLNQDKVNAQFQELGLKPEDVISKVMANPELAAGFQNPKVQAAIMDISQNPMNVTKYQADPEIMKVLMQVTTIFSPDMAQNQQ